MLKEFKLEVPSRALWHLPVCSECHGCINLGMNLDAQAEGSSITLHQFSTWFVVQFKKHLSEAEARDVVKQARLVCDFSVNGTDEISTDTNSVSPVTEEVSTVHLQQEPGSPPSTPQKDEAYSPDDKSESPGFLAEQLLSGKPKLLASSTNQLLTPITGHQIEGLQTHVSCSLQYDESLQSEAPTQAPTIPPPEAPELEIAELQPETSSRVRTSTIPRTRLCEIKDILDKIDEHCKQKGAGTDSVCIKLVEQGLELVKRVQTENFTSGASVTTMSFGDCALPGPLVLLARSPSFAHSLTRSFTRSFVHSADVEKSRVFEAELLQKRVVILYNQVSTQVASGKELEGVWRQLDEDTAGLMQLQSHPKSVVLKPEVQLRVCNFRGVVLEHDGKIEEALATWQKGIDEIPASSKGEQRECILKSMKKLKEKRALLKSRALTKGGGTQGSSSKGRGATQGSSSKGRGSKRDVGREGRGGGAHGYDTGGAVGSDVVCSSQAEVGADIASMASMASTTTVDSGSATYTSEIATVDPAEQEMSGRGGRDRERRGGGEMSGGGRGERGEEIRGGESKQKNRQQQQQQQPSPKPASSKQRSSVPKPINRMAPPPRRLGSGSSNRSNSTSSELESSENTADQMTGQYTIHLCTIHLGLCTIHLCTIH
jgi:hypothetical protein